MGTLIFTMGGLIAMGIAAAIMETGLPTRNKNTNRQRGSIWTAYVCQ